jgi:hypothetical protein
LGELRESVPDPRYLVSGIVSSSLPFSAAFAAGLPGQYGTFAGIFSYLSLESVEKKRFRLRLWDLMVNEVRHFYGIMEKRKKKYMKNANFSCITEDSVASYGC